MGEGMDKYFITLDKFTLEEYEVWKLLCRYSNYENDITGYTINQIVIAADTRLDLTTQKVRTILKNFERSGYLQQIQAGTKGKETTAKLMLKDKLFSEKLTNNQQQSNNHLANKSEQLQQVEDLSNNNLTTKQQIINNTTKKKEKDNIIYSRVIEKLNSTANTNYRASTKKTKGLIDARLKDGFVEADFMKVIEVKAKEWLGTEFEKFLRPETLFGNKFEGYLNQANKKGPTAIGPTNKNNSYSSSICKSKESNTEKIKFINNFS